MGKRPPTDCRAYDAIPRKTFHGALCHLLQTEFPGIFGPTITRLFADKIVDLHERFHPPASRFKVGQVLWVGVAVNDPPAREKRIENSQLIPVILDLVTAQDIDETVATELRAQTRLNKIRRLFQQAYERGAVLSLADVSLLLHVHISTVSQDIQEYERGTKELVPRRGTIHDMGRSVTHKAIICYKRLVEQKPTSQVALETRHSDTEVEYYVQQLRTVQLCHDNGMSKEEIAQATGRSLFLVREYLDLIERFQLPPLPTSRSSARRKDGVQSGET
jgi:hypothetical protein